MGQHWTQDKTMSGQHQTEVSYRHSTANIQEAATYQRYPSSKRIAVWKRIVSAWLFTCQQLSRLECRHSSIHDSGFSVDGSVATYMSALPPSM